jgi:thioredoxin 1
MSNTTKIAHLNEDEWQSRVVESEIPVFVEFSTTWCGPCHAMAPMIAELAEQFDGKVKFVDVDADKNPGLATKFEVFSVPTFVVLKDGEPKQRFVGMATKGYMTKLLQSSTGRG